MQTVAIKEEKKLKGSNRWRRTWWNRTCSSSTSFLIPQTQSFHKLLIPPRPCSWVGKRLLVTHMICRKPVFQTELDPTIFASNVVRKCQNLSTTLHRTNRFLLLTRITISRSFVFLKQRLDSFLVKTSCFDCCRTCFADGNCSASVVWVWTIVGLVWSMLQTEHL